MTLLSQGRYSARFAETKSDLLAAQSLRSLAFGLDVPIDADRFDDNCAHVLVEETRSGALVCCFRMMFLTGETLSDSYSAQYYDLSGLEAYQGRMVEMGRFCVAPNQTDPDILRIAWGAMTRYVEEEGIDLLFGCSSFAGIETDGYLDTFAMLNARHLAPKRWLPRVKAPDVFRFANRLRRVPDVKKAKRAMPPLLKTYLRMGGWVSDHAVIDRYMNTLHVFTGVEIRSIPATRKRLLQAVAR